jgi:protein gp37
MSKQSGIEWTDASWNVIGGCTEASEGCDHCYARRGAYRMQFNPNAPRRYEGTVRRYQGKYLWTYRINLDWEALEDPAPLRWTKPRRIFVCSMSDLFHPEVPENFIWRVVEIAWKAQQHTFMILTKRPTRMMDVLTRSCWWNNDTPENIWLGVTAENQKRADERVPPLLETPAARHFVSIEPMLGPVDLRHVQTQEVEIDALTGDHGVHRPLSGRSDRKLDWVIVGGESGREARPMHPDWARSVRNQCDAAGIPFFFKQWGEWRAADNPEQVVTWLQNGAAMRQVGSAPCLYRVGKKTAGRELDGRTWDEWPD